MQKKTLVSEIITEQKKMLEEQMEFCKSAKEQLLAIAADMEKKANKLKKYLDGEEKENG